MTKENTPQACNIVEQWEKESASLGYPFVFISYAHASPEHKEWVKRFCFRLRQDKVLAVMDHFVPYGYDLICFMEQIVDSKSLRNILCVCSSEYTSKAQNGDGGVGYEKMIITSSLAENIGGHKLIPIIRDNPKATRPPFLRNRKYCDFRNDSDFENMYQELLSDILGLPKEPSPINQMVAPKPLPVSLPSSNKDSFDIFQLSNPAIELLAACLRKGEPVYMNMYQQLVFAASSLCFISELHPEQQNTSHIVNELVTKQLFIANGCYWSVSDLAKTHIEEILQADFELCVTTPKPLGFCDIVSSGLREGQNLVASPYVLHVPFCEIPRQYRLKIDNVELQPLLPAKACNQLFDYLEKRNIIHCEHSFEYDKEQMFTKRTGIVTAYGQRFSHRWREYVSPQTPYFEFLNQNTLPTKSPINDVPQPDILDDIPEKVLEWLVEIHCSDDKQLQVVDVGNRYPEYTRFELYAGELSYKVCGNSALYRNNPDAFWQDLREAQDFFATLKKYLVNTHRPPKYNSEAIAYELTPEGHVIAQIALNRLDLQRASKS